MRTPNAKKPAWSLFGALGAAIAASACCTVPLMLVSAGVGGAWLSGLRALEPYRPFFIILAVGLIGFAFFRSYKARQAFDCACEPRTRPRAPKTLLGIGALLTAGLIASPWLVPAAPTASTALPSMPPGIETAILHIEGMSCPSCTTTVTRALHNTEGVMRAEVTYTPPQAVVHYDPSLTGIDALIKAVMDTGYSVIDSATTSSPAE